MKRAILTVFALLLAGGVFGLDLTLDLGAKGSLPLANPAAPTPSLEEHVQLGQAIGENVYVKLELSHSTSLWSGSGAWYAPLDAGSLVTAEYIGGIGMAGVTVAFDAGPGPASPGRIELGAFASGSLPLVGDLLALEGELRGASDLSGILGTMRIAPTLYLPLARPTMVDLGVEVEAAAGDYRGSGYAGLGHLDLGPDLRVSLDRTATLGFSGGYYLDFSGTRLSAKGSYLHAECTLSFSLEAPAN
jgi:hypothetical protein